MLKLVWSLAGVFGLRRYLEDYFLRRLSEAFGAQEPLSTSFADAYAQPAYGIKELPPPSAVGGMTAGLRRSGAVSLAAGLYDFAVEGFCLRAGGYSPAKGDGYLAAPLKGSRAAVISAILSASSKHPEVSQQAVQTLLWAVESGARYPAIKGDARLAADVLLSEEHKNNLGKSFWDAVPGHFQNLITDELYSRLPDAVREPLRVYRALKNRLESVGTYSEIERLAVLFNPPASSTAIKSGAWSAMPGGYYVRAFPSGYTAARLQVFVPPAAGRVNFSLENFIIVPADATRQRLGFRAPPDKETPHPEQEKEIEIIYKPGERLSNPDVIAALKKLAEMLGADKVEVTGGDRTRAEHDKIYENLPEDKRVPYERTQHGEYQGYTAADAKFYKDGKQINPDIVAGLAEQSGDLGGIGYYDTFTHIDLRPKQPDGRPKTWDERTK